MLLTSQFSAFSGTLGRRLLQQAASLSAELALLRRAKGQYRGLVKLITAINLLTSSSHVQNRHLSLLGQILKHPPVFISSALGQTRRDFDS